MLALKQKDEENLSPSIEYVNIIHGDSKGWITKAKICNKDTNNGIISIKT